MAEERDDAQRTEEPTGRRLDEAHRKGDVVKSQELTTFFMLAAGTLSLLIFGGMSVRTFSKQFLVFLESPADFNLDPGTATHLYQHALMGFFLVLAPAGGLILLAAVAGHVVQSGLLFSGERVKPDLSKLSLISGAKRIFGLDGIVNLIKGIAKVVLVGGAAFAAAWPERARLASALDLNAAAAGALAITLILRVLLAVLIVFAAIAALDYFYQRQRFMARHRMTKQELRDEMKQSEGDPQIKARIRQIRLERSRKRMIAAVPQATVVIANPTHYAVALKYESGKMRAPVCVAKGVDLVALTIRQVAEEHDVPVVENPPLARALFASVEIDAEIPAEHFKAVAQVIGYVMRLAKQSSFWRK